ncbi:hypothetical protein CR513_15225, partial [Mucuna pruriens]
MESSSFNLEDPSPKSRLIMDYMKKLDHGVKSKKKKKKRSKKMLLNPWDLIKDKIPPFTGKGSVDDYYDWELKVTQNLDYINCEDLTKVKLITLSFEGYALVWWNEIALQIRGMMRASIKS